MSWRPMSSWPATARACTPSGPRCSRLARRGEFRAALRGYHSGNWGGLLSNPAIVLAHAIATLVDARGRITVPGLRPPPIPLAVAGAPAELDVGGGADDPAIDAHCEPGLSASERCSAGTAWTC